MQKKFRLAATLALLVVSNGCMTYSAIEDAKGHSESDLWAWGPSTEGTNLWIKSTHIHATNPQPGYYLLMPLTVPVDVATSPLQAAYFFGYPYLLGKEMRQ